MNVAEGLISESLLNRADVLNVLFDSSADRVELLTIDGRVARINDSGLQEMEIDDPAIVLGVDWVSLWPVAQQKDVREAVRRASSGEVAKFHGYCPTARGTPKWWNATVSAIRDQGGDLVALLAVSRDVSEYAAGRQALVTLAEGGVIVGWSLQAQAMFGWSAEEAIGRGLELIVPERMREVSRVWTDRVIAEGEIAALGRPVETVALRRTGEEFPVECVHSLLPTGAGLALLASIQDISTARAQTQLFENAFENGPIGKALVSLEGRFLKLNGAFASLVGYDEAVLLAKDFQSITHPNDLDADLVHLKQLVAGTIPSYQIDKRYVRADGSPVWVNLSVSLVRFADGRPKFFIAQVQDLTARRKAEERYRLLAENVSDVVSLQDGAGRCLYASPSAERVFGYTPEEVIGALPSSFIPEPSRARFRAIEERLAHVPRGETVTQQLQIRRKDGRAAWVEIACRIIPDDAGKPVTVVVTRDISDRLETEQRYRLLADNMADILVLADLDCRATFMAGACERILGWTPEEVLRRRGEGLIHPDDLAEVKGAYGRVCAGEQGVRVRFRSQSRSGAWRWMESRPSLFEAESGELGVVDAVRDVTEQVAQEEALAQAREEAEAAALAKSRFLANMSHEIRTPLTSVIGFSDLLLGRDDLQADVRRYADRIGSASRALLTLVNDVLDFSKIEAGQFEIRPAPCRPRELVEESMAIFTAAAEAKGVQLRLETEVAAETTVEVDAARIRQVLLNLIGNAVKFTEAGQVAVRLDCAEGRLAVAVRDSGPGMAPEDQRKLFQRFSQVDASSTRRHGGTGLGLAICKGLVEAMGGSIGVRSQLGSGSTFEFTIAAPVAETAAPPAAIVEDAHIERVRILVADDNPANRELVRAILEGFGAEITEAADGLEAVEAASAATYDVILMDVRMPKLDGHGALQQIRSARGPNQATPVLAFTADVLDSELAEFDGAISKPIEPMRLAEAIEACLAPSDQAPPVPAASNGVGAR